MNLRFAAFFAIALLASLPFGLCAQTPDWRTPAEISGYRTTPDYAETVAYLERIAAAAPGQVKIENFGKTGEGRDLKIVIASKDGVFDPAAIHASGRAILLVQNAIHAGEMDGKDACLALLRDIVQDQNGAKRLLDHVVFVFIPVYNIDGHERRSAYNRINQNGPELSGWRSNGTNLNLNRDYMKADAPETRAFLKMFHRWLPDFFVDDHVTDGADFQYDVTFMIDDAPDVAPATAKWIRDAVTPELERQVNASGHLAFPALINLNNETDPAQGLAYNPDRPRFSTGQMILENRPGLLVELHMLKDYKTRVTGNYEILRALLEVMNRDAAKLIALNREADAAAAKLGAHPFSSERFPLITDWNGETTPVVFHGYKFTRALSEISGAMRVSYSHEPWNVTLPLATGAKVTASVTLPAGYIVPPQWTQAIDVLAAHDVTLRRTTAPWTGKVERYRCSGMQWRAQPFEGRHPIFGGENQGAQPGRYGQCTLTNDTLTFPAGSVVVPLNQRLSKVAIHWLEPEAPDSALRWGFFDPIFEQKEYGEAYVLEKLARENLAKDPALKAEFEHQIQSNPRFAASPEARLEFFYERSPWFQENRVGQYPVGRLISLDGLPLE
ncbi:MAG TPA: M14 family metallopeptidase [Terracidiphilus sp.]|nr:M14 family metallopeptidase [Terracidiphilus sp.]